MEMLMKFVVIAETQKRTSERISMMIERKLFNVAELYVDDFFFFSDMYKSLLIEIVYSDSVQQKKLMLCWWEQARFFLIEWVNLVQTEM